MKQIGLTGGIASGKSTVLAWLKAYLHSSLAVFDSDVIVSELLNRADVVSEIDDMFGSSVVTGSSIDRLALRDLIFTNSAERQKLEDVLHPKVFKECLARAELAEHRSEVSYFVADIPLLFEAAYDWPVQSVWTVACGRQTQCSRLMKRSGIDEELAVCIVDAQLPMDYKIERSDLVLWNEGPVECLRQQLEAIIL